MESTFASDSYLGDLADGTLKRACDQCRLRKIRCDKESPCSNCKTAKRACSSSGLGQRPKEARQRVLISSQYERKIDQFEARLAGIESMLRELTLTITNSRNPSTSASATDYSESPRPTRAPSHATPSSHHSTANTTATPATNIHNDDEAIENDLDAFEGDSSMAAQTAFASEFLHKAVGRTSFCVPNPDMESALQALQQMVAGRQRDGGSLESRFEHVLPIPPGGFRELPKPPTELIVNLLRVLKEKPPSSFGLIWIVAISADRFSECCRAVYFPTEDFSLTTFAIVMGGLYFFLQEMGWGADGAEAEKLARFQEMCRANFETALVSLPLLMPATRASVEVLLTATLYATEVAKFALASRFNIMAATICQTLGYHRQPLNPTPEQQSISDHQAALFWFVYANDKCLSLRFGRCSQIQDYDITVSRTLGASVVLPDPGWRVVFHQWTTHAEFLGHAYEQLYSAAALTRSPQERAESAHALIRSLKAMNSQLAAERAATGLAATHESLPPGTAPREKGPNPYSIDMAVMSDEVMLYCAMTLIYRSVPPSGGEGTLYAECVEAARKAVASHHECMTLSPNKHVDAGIISWTLLFIPFYPVIVIFCHVIKCSDQNDLQRLSEFTDSLYPAATVSKATEKFYRVCAVLTNVARLYTESKARQEQDQEMLLVGNDIDMYLSQLGFMPSQVDPMTHSNSSMYGDAGNGVGNMEANQGVDLSNWFSANLHVLGFAEDIDFEPRAWPAAPGPQ